MFLERRSAGEGGCRTDMAMMPMYDAQMGRKNVQLQVSEMGLMVFEKKSGSKLNTYLYKSLVQWGRLRAGAWR